MKVNKAQQIEESKVYAKTWEENATPETHDPIARVVVKLEKQKKLDRSLKDHRYIAGKIRSTRRETA